MISEDNYNHFITKIPVLQQQVKENEMLNDKYYEIDKETYNYLQNMQNTQNDQHNSERKEPYQILVI